MNFRTTLVSTALLISGLVQAQVLGTITASSNKVKVGEPVTITAHIDVINANYCGFVVGFGDGTFKDAVSDVNTPVPLVITRTYSKPGTYHVTLGGRNVQSHPNCGGPERAVDITVTGAAAKVATPAKPGDLCAKPWKLSGKRNAKTGAFTCAAKAGTVLPATKPVCSAELSYFENTKKGQYGCKP